MKLPGRREFLRQTGFAAGGLALASLNLACAASSAPSMRVALEGSRISFNTDIPELSTPGSAVSLESMFLEHPIFLIRQNDGTLAALSAECTHRGCTVKKEPTLLRCPCHDSGFDLQGNVLNGPADAPLHRYQVIMQGHLAQIIVEG